MIEFCSKRRMVAGIAILITASVVVLMVENNLPMGHETKTSESKSSENVSKPCPDNSQVKISLPCRPCTQHDLKIFDWCKPTGYREAVVCVSSDGKETTLSKSCPVHGWVKEKTFWVFEGSTAVVGLLSYSVVYLRQRRLDRLLIEKVHRQIAAGV